MENNNTISEIAQGLNIAHLPETDQQKAVELFADNVASRAMAVAWEKFSDRQKQDIENLAGNPMEIFKYLRKDLPDFSQLVEDVSRELAEDFRQKIARLQEKG